MKNRYKELQSAKPPTLNLIKKRLEVAVKTSYPKEYCEETSCVACLARTEKAIHTILECFKPQNQKALKLMLDKKKPSRYKLQLI